MERKKGQVELVAIAGLIIIVLIVVFLMMQQFMIQPPITPGTGSEVKTVKDSINNFIQAGLMEVLVKIYNQGGYSNLAGIQTVDFGKTRVPVWQACEKLSIPDVENEIGAEVSKYIRQNLKEEILFFGKNVIIDIPSVQATASILKDSVKVEVYLPTYVEGNDIPLPYIASVDSNLREILEFSGAFVRDSSSTRFFEKVTLATILFSNPDNPNWMPILGAATECNKPVVKRRPEMVEGITEIAEYVASHTVWNDKPARLARNPFYSLNRVGGKEYDLEVMFSYPKEWDMDSNFQFGPNPLKISPKPFSFDLGVITLPMPIQICTDVYGVTYSIKYPLVIMVEDESINQWFKFAIMNEIDQNEPGDCVGDLDDISAGYSKEICVNQSRCEINITVTDDLGVPIEGADVFFYECDLGSTDEEGRMITYVPCGVSEIKVYKDGHKAFGNFTSYHHLTNTTIVLGRKHNITVYFFGVPMEGLNLSYNRDTTTTYFAYRVTGEPRPITEFSKVKTELVFKPINRDIFTGEDVDIVAMNLNYSSGEFMDNYTVNGIMYNNYILQGKSIDITNGEGKGIDMGHNNATMQIRDETDLYVYYPIVERWVKIYGIMAGKMKNGISMDDIPKLRRKFGYCGIDFFSFTKQTDFSGFNTASGCTDFTP